MLNGKIYIYPKIVAQMAQNGDTLKTLSSDLGIGYQALSARLRGRKAFELPEIYGLIKKYNCSFDDLFTQATVKDAPQNHEEAN